MDLPVELVQMIAERLPFHSVLALSLTCRALYSILLGDRVMVARMHKQLSAVSCARRGMWDFLAHKLDSFEYSYPIIQRALIHAVQRDHGASVHRLLDVCAQERFPVDWNVIRAAMWKDRFDLFSMHLRFGFRFGFTGREVAWYETYAAELMSRLKHADFAAVFKFFAPYVRLHLAWFLFVILEMQVRSHLEVVLLCAGF